MRVVVTATAAARPPCWELRPGTNGTARAIRANKAARSLGRAAHKRSPRRSLRRRWPRSHARCTECQRRRHCTRVSSGVSRRACPAAAPKFRTSRAVKPKSSTEHAAVPAPRARQRQVDGRTGGRNECELAPRVRAGLAQLAAARRDGKTTRRAVSYISYGWGSSLGLRRRARVAARRERQVLVVPGRRGAEPRWCWAVPRLPDEGLGLDVDVCEGLDVGRVPCAGSSVAAVIVQDSLLKRLEKEPKRSHLDMRHRLDKDGKRYGRVIDYRCDDRRNACSCGAQRRRARPEGRGMGRRERRAPTAETPQQGRAASRAAPHEPRGAVRSAAVPNGPVARLAARAALERAAQKAAPPPPDRFGRAARSVSELRVAELLDDLCEDMTQWTWGRAYRESSLYRWVPRNSNGGNTAEAVTPQAEMRTRKRELKTFCYGAVERAEDGLATYLASEAPHHEGARAPALRCLNPGGQRAHLPARLSQARGSETSLLASCQSTDNCAATRTCCSRRWSHEA